MIHDMIHNIQKIEVFFLDVRNDAREQDRRMSATDIEQPIIASTDDVSQRPAEIQTQQSQLDILMGILEENQANMPEGDYLRGMNALCALHKKKGTNEMNTRFMTHEEVCEDEEIFEPVIELAEDIVYEISGGSIFDDDKVVDSGEETAFLNQIINYQPAEGEAGFGANPHLMYHAQRFIYCRLYNDLIDELGSLRPAVCKCGWRGTQGNWERHTNNRRHKIWVVKRNSLFDTETDADTDNDAAPEVIIVD